MRFPSRLLAANVWFALMVWAGFTVLLAVVTAVIAVFGTVSMSVWDQATQLPRWYALFAGVALVREFLPMYVAHGQTRRQFGAQAAVTIALFAPFLAALIAVGYLLEAAVYGLAGWPQSLNRVHLYTEPTQVGLVLVEFTVEFLAWVVAGTFIGAGFYRWQGPGLLTIPVGVGLIALTRSAIGSDLPLPFLDGDLGLALPASPGLAVVVGLAVFLAGLALTWSVIRDVPLRNRPA